MTCAGDLECDATTVRKWRHRGSGENVYYQIFALLRRHQPGLQRRFVNLFELPLVRAKAGGKPPPESMARIEASGALESIGRYDSRGFKTLLIADGARCYPRLARQKRLLLRQCNHSKGLFSLRTQVGRRGKTLVHTGGVDSFWKIAKKSLPDSLASREGGHVRNKTLWRYLRAFQWRWEKTGTPLLEATAAKLATL